MVKKSGKISDSKDDVLESAYKLQNIDDWEDQFRSLLVKNDEKNLFDWLCDKYHEDSSKAILFLERCDKKTQQKFAITMKLPELAEGKNNLGK